MKIVQQVSNKIVVFDEDLGNKYLYLRKGTYYFSIRIRTKPIKISLKSKNLEYCKRLRDLILYFILQEHAFRGMFHLREDYVVDLSEKVKQYNLREKIARTIAEHITRELYKTLYDYVPIEKQKKEEKPKENKNLYIVNNLEILFERFKEHRKNFKNVGTSSLKNYNAALKYLKYFSDENTIFNFNFFKQLQHNINQLPKHIFSSQKAPKKFKEYLLLKKKQDYDTLNNKTINNHMNTYKMFFDFLQYDEVIHFEINPVEKVIALPEQKETDKQEFTNEELTALFESDMIEPLYKDFIKVCLYTGFRIEELSTLQKTDIDLEENLIYINLEDTSTKKHKKQMPIHKNILPIIKRQIINGEDNLLFWNKTKNAIGKAVNLRINKVVPNKNKTFHSLRKCFAQELEINTNAEEKTKKYLLSHTYKDVTHIIYNRGKINIEKLKDCINQITFKF